MDSTLQDHFGSPISIYTDAQILEDGGLIDISNLHVLFRGRPITRMTQHLWADFDPFLIKSWPPGVPSPSPMQQLAKILKTKIALAYYKGDIWQVPPGLWLIENEQGAWTLMFPEDY